MKVRLQSFPKLSGVTLVDGREQPITVVLEVPRYFAKEPWEVVAWHSSDNNDWCALHLDAFVTEEQLVELHVSSPDISRLAFGGILSFKESLQFTVKFRHANDQPWVWVREEYGLDDGSVVRRSGRMAVAKSDLPSLIPNLNAEWTVSPLSSQSPETQLWSLETDIAPSADDVSAHKSLDIGTPFGGFQKWFAMVRSSTPWLAPRKGSSQLTLDKDAMICSFQDKNGQNLVFLGVSGVEGVQSMFYNNQPGCLSVHSRNDATSARKMLILVAKGIDFERALASVVYHARSLVWHMSSQDVKDHDRAATEAPEGSGDTKAQWRERWYDGLGYCTWNALGPDLTENRILDALATLKRNDISISNLIIDDNWQSIESTDKGASGHAQPRWLKFEANKDGFPGGLRQTVSKIRLQNSNIEHVGVWHAIVGYWGGISPRGELAKKYATTNTILDTGDGMTVIAKDDISKFYDDFYLFLTQSGIDMVKTDAQSLLDSFDNASARYDLTNAYLDKWSIASLRHFGFNAISCMSQYPRAIIHAHLPQLRPPVVMRNSDDYFPDVASSHRWHVWSNAHNAMLTQYLNVIPDWDMFQTVHEYAHYHAAARCISGGPIYITDQPGKHNLSLIRQMTAITPIGKTIVLRPSVIGRALDPYLDFDTGALLEIGTYHGAADTGFSMISVFQTSDARNPSLIPLTNFPGIAQSGDYIIRAFTTGLIKRVSMKKRETPIVLATTGEHGYEIYSVFHSSIVEGRTHRTISLANLGLVDKMAGCAAILSSSVKAVEDRRITAVAKLKGLGVFGIYISGLPKMDIDKHFMVTISDTPVPRHTVKISKQDSCVLEIDAAAAWKEMGIDNGWNNEVEIKVSFDA